MTEFVDVKSFLEEKFEIKVEASIVENIMLIKMNGLDNNSLAKYIVQNFEGLKVSVKEKEGYKFGNNGWIKIEKNNNNNSVLELIK